MRPPPTSLVEMESGNTTIPAMKNTKKAVCKAGKVREKAKADKTARAKRIAARESGDNASKGKASVKAGNFGRCWLCLEEKRLVASHVIPKFHTKEMMDAKEHAYCIFIPFSNEGRVSGRKVQDHHEPLFCQPCDQRFSPVERDYSKWWKRLLLDKKTLRSGERYTIDHMGEWSEERASNARDEPVITLTGVDMHLIKQMQLINIFRLHCHIASECRQGNSSEVQKYRRIVLRFLEPQHSSLCVDHLADFSVRATYVYIPSGEQFKQNTSPNEPLDILPATMLSLGLEIILARGDACCFTGPIFWQIEEKLDASEQTSLMLDSRFFEGMFPGVRDKMIRYDPNSRRKSAK